VGYTNYTQEVRNILSNSFHKIRLFFFQELKYVTASSTSKMDLDHCLQMLLLCGVGLSTYRWYGGQVYPLNH